MSQLDTLIQQYRAENETSSTKITRAISTCAWLFSLLILLSWVSLSFGGEYHLPFSWLLCFGLLFLYLKINVKCAITTFLLLCFINLIAIAIGYPAPNHSNLLFLVLILAVATVLELYQFKINTDTTLTQHLTHLIDEPLLLTIDLFTLMGIEQFIIKCTSPSKTKTSQSKDPKTDKRKKPAATPVNNQPE